MLLSVCGLICDECQFYPDSCDGCSSNQGKPFWTIEATAEGICPLYQCAVHDNHFKDCGECAELPCQKFFDLKDPNISDTEHQIMIKKRTEILRNKNIRSG